MDIDGIAVGVIAGLIIGALIFTPSGRRVTGATGERAAYHIRPRNNNRRR